ncbi:uncharacterized protein N7483_002261 [Penicillium malachiteum]|uniref:uncharacterized protein n=1 Tax=Penicillium malachiteum TaxID=1324776 RepID=UPI002548F1F6|nr:uncharacterized protein N7483_002261 [Penicillium malachiteum]KAJ5737136.1 hypothetical protein N7483_002261 [Penicillium malachiteum]
MNSTFQPSKGVSDPHTQLPIIRCSRRFCDPSPGSGEDGSPSISRTQTLSGYPSRIKLKKLDDTILSRSSTQPGSEKSSRSDIKLSVKWDLGLYQLCGLLGTCCHEIPEGISKVPHQIYSYRNITVKGVVLCSEFSFKLQTFVSYGPRRAKRAQHGQIHGAVPSDASWPRFY